jgi:hypothetical protein
VSNRRTLADRAFLADRVRSILESKRLTLSHVSQISAQRFGRSSSFFLPHTLYHQLRLTNFDPSTYQIFALSHISGYRFFDWFRVFGFNLEHIPKLQLQLPSSRTVLLDSSWVDAESWLRFPQDRPENRVIPSIAPLASLVELSSPRRLASFRKNTSNSLYAKIGSQDTLAFPDLLPGSIVRVNPKCGDGLPADAEGKEFRRLFLIEHSRGFCCCRLRSVGNRLIVPLSNELSYAQVELEWPRQVRVLGALDLEVRSLCQAKQPEVPRDLALYWHPQALARSPRLGDLLRAARANKKLSLRDITAQSLRVADLLNDRRYVVSPSALSDYELLSVAPRDFHKSLAVSLAYGVEFPKFLEAVGIPLENAGPDPMPDRLVPEFLDSASLPAPAHGSRSPDRGFMPHLLAKFGEVPFFLRDSTQHNHRSGRDFLGQLVLDRRPGRTPVSILGEWTARRGQPTEEASRSLHFQTRMAATRIHDCQTRRNLCLRLLRRRERDACDPSIFDQVPPFRADSLSPRRRDRWADRCRCQTAPLTTFDFPDNAVIVFCDPPARIARKICQLDAKPDARSLFSTKTEAVPTLPAG